MFDLSPVRGAPIPELRIDVVRFVGGSSAVTKVYGPGVTTTYVGSGVVNLVWADNPGAFLGMTHGFQATTTTALKGYTVTAGVFNTTTLTLPLLITNASDSGTDLAALQWLTVNCFFSGSGAIPS